MNQIAVIGAGTMGRGIAQLAAIHGHDVILVDQSEQVLIDARDKLDYFIQRLAAKGKLSNEDAVAAFGRLHFTSEMSAIEGSDLVIEAIIENLEIKQKVFRQIESLVSDDCILASNTSSLSITSIASCLEDPSRCIGMHFFNPAPLMKLVELIPAIQSDHGYIKRADDLLDGWGKTTVVAKDTPAFIVNRIARPFYSEAMRIHEEGIAEPATIDWAMKEIGGFRMGPFALMDFIGHDVNYKVTETVFEAFYYDKRYIPSFTQKRLVEAGYLGRKSGRGFYSYETEDQMPEANQDHELGQDIVDRILVMLINEAAEAMLFSVASRDDIESAMTLGVNYPKGLLAWAEDIGYPRCVSRLDALHDRYREERYRCSAWLRDQM